MELDYSPRAGTDQPAPAGFLSSVENRLVEATNMLNNVANKLYEAGFPAGPSSVGGEKASEDSPRARIYRRLDELYDLANSVTQQVERII